MNVEDIIKKCPVCQGKMEEKEFLTNGIDAYECVDCGHLISDVKRRIDRLWDIGEKSGLQNEYLDAFIYLFQNRFPDYNIDGGDMAYQWANRFKNGTIFQNADDKSRFVLIEAFKSVLEDYYEKKETQFAENLRQEIYGVLDHGLQNSSLSGMARTTVSHRLSKEVVELIKSNLKWIGV